MLGVVRRLEPALVVLGFVACGGETSRLPPDAGTGGAAGTGGISGASGVAGAQSGGASGSSGGAGASPCGGKPVACVPNQYVYTTPDRECCKTDGAVCDLAWREEGCVGDMCIATECTCTNHLWRCTALATCFLHCLDIFDAGP